MRFSTKISPAPHHEWCPPSMRGVRGSATSPMKSCGGKTLMIVVIVVVVVKVVIMVVVI